MWGSSYRGENIWGGYEERVGVDEKWKDGYLRMGNMCIKLY